MKVPKFLQFKKFRKFYNLEKLSNTLTVQLIKKITKYKFINKIIE